MKILIIEDDNDVVKFLKPALKSEGFSVDAASDGEEGEYMSLVNKYDLLILDLNIPKKSGKAICKKLRESDKTFPIIVLTAEQGVVDKVDLLNLGADDYMTKPFSLDELLARIKAVLRRNNNFGKKIIEYDGIVIDKEKQTIKKNNKEIYLTLKEFSLLEYLIDNRGKTISRGLIVEHVWDMNADLFSNTIETHISNLRKKLDKDPHRIIKTVPTRGYRID